MPPVAHPVASFTAMALFLTFFFLELLNLSLTFLQFQERRFRWSRAGYTGEPARAPTTHTINQIEPR